MTAPPPPSAKVLCCPFCDGSVSPYGDGSLVQHHASDGCVLGSGMYSTRLWNRRSQPQPEANHRYVDIVFDGPPGPECGRFVEVENELGHGIKFGEWVQRPDGYWVLRIAKPQPEAQAVLHAALRQYGVHPRSCVDQQSSFREPGEYQCRCGLSQILKEYKP